MTERRVDLSNIDLDAVATLIQFRQRHWRALGLTAGELTWTDNIDAWPVPLLHDRSAVGRPRSVGVRVSAARDAEAEFVVHAGGWADAIWIAPDLEQPTSEYVELGGAQKCGPLLDRVAARLTMVEVPVESLTVGDVVELSTRPAPVLIRLTLIKPRTSGFKIEGRSVGGGLYSSGCPYGKAVRRLVGEEAADR